ncbi:MAG TPA: hypothetical protein V6D11_24095 [Waterburya sp.]|jgi:cell division septum initiation protein DivIVA
MNTKLNSSSTSLAEENETLRKKIEELKKILKARKKSERKLYGGFQNLFHL